MNSTTKLTTGNQFALPSATASLQARQAAAFAYMKGYLGSHFKANTELTCNSYLYMRQEIIRLFDVDLLDVVVEVVKVPFWENKFKS